MAGFQAGSQELMQAAKRMDETNQALQANLKQVEGAAQSVEGAWKGSAAAAFQQLIQRYAADAKKLQDSLQGIKDNIEGTARTTQQTEDEAGSAIGSILNG